MTEVERIINKGIVSTDYIKEEIMCDFLVDERRKKIWAIELDLLYELDRVCKKYDLKYYACGGTVLGAVRHKGFIPWDDDMDFYMFRDEYEELLSHADEFKNPYLLQTPYTDDGYFYSFAKLRNANTTFASDYFIYNDWNMGIFIDIFPMDAYILSELKDSYKKIGELASDNSTYMRMSNPYLDEANKKRVAAHSGRNPFDVYEEIQTIAQRYKNDDRADCFVEIVCAEYPQCEKKILRAEELSDVIYLPFENTKIPTFSGYENHLKRMYGDYMQFPPIEDRGVWHIGATFDPDIPYKEYIESKRIK